MKQKKFFPNLNWKQKAVTGARAQGSEKAITSPPCIPMSQTAPWPTRSELTNRSREATGRGCACASAAQSQPCSRPRSVHLVLVPLFPPIPPAICRCAPAAPTAKQRGIRSPESSSAALQRHLRLPVIAPPMFRTQNNKDHLDNMLMSRRVC